jgi:3-oxoacyl-[acyl-carrier-protein] synthase III
MRASLEAFGVVTGRRGGALDLADAAIVACLQRASLSASDVDLLINCGLYREDNLSEPALAALIQEDVGANPGHPPIGGHGTFSFDIAAGTCGPITAMQIVDGLVRSGVVRHAVIVASDVHPKRHEPEGAPPFRPVGAAALLSATADGGFAGFATQLFPEHAGDLQAGIRWRSKRRHLPFRPAGEQVLVLERSEQLTVHAVSAAAEVARRILDEHGLRLEEVAAVVTPDARGIGAKLAAEVGRPAVVTDEGAHTAGVLVALARAKDDGVLDRPGPVLVVTTSAGLHVSCAVHAR